MEAACASRVRSQNSLLDCLRADHGGFNVQRTEPVRRTGSRQHFPVRATFDVGLPSRTFSKISPSSIPAAVNHRAALLKPQRQSFADFYIATQKSCRYDEEAVCSGRNRNMRFILGDGPAVNGTHLRRRTLRDGHFSDGGPRCTHVCFGHFRHVVTASRLRGHSLPEIRFVLEIGDRVDSLLITLVEVQVRIELRLAGEQLFQSLLVLERAICLGLVVRKLFLDAGDPILLLSCDSVEIS